MVRRTAPFLILAASLILGAPAVSAQPAAPAGADLQLVRCEEERPGVLPGKLLLHVTVKNAGKGQSVDALLHARFLDAAGVFVDQAWVRLGHGRIDPGAEVSFDVAIPGCPEYRRLATAVMWGTEYFQLPDNAFTSAPELEIGECSFQRFSNGDLLVRGKVRNGRAKPAGDVEASFEFKNAAGKVVKTAAKRLAGSVASGAVVPFRHRIRECPAVVSVAASVEGRDAEAAGAAAPADADDREEGLAAAAEAAKPAAAPPRAEPGPGEAVGPAARAADPPRTPPANPPAADPNAPPYAIRVEGLTWVNGTYKPGGTSNTLQYTGDTAFLKLAFTDAQGAPAKPEATVIVKVADNEKPRGFCKRQVTKTSWKLDAQKLNADTAAPEVVAWHAKDGTLWVGLVRAEDSEQTSLTLDVSVEIRKYGAWTWKGLRDPYRTGLTPPDPGKKK